MATIDRYYFKVCTDGARRKGVDVDKLLRIAGIAPESLSNMRWRGDVASMARLVRAIWTELEDEFMGYTPTPMALGAFEFASELAASGPSVGEGISRAVRFYNLATRDISTQLSHQGDQLTIQVRFREPSLDPTHYFSEFWLIIWHRLACWLAGETIPMLKAEIDYPRPDAYFEEFKYLFPCVHRFNAQHRAIVLDARALSVPVRRTADELREMTASAPLALMTIPASDLTLARQARLIMLNNPSVSIDAVATALDLTPDTLRRRLRREGTSLSTIRENIRRDIATRELVSSSRSIESIAASLCYAEARSFTRAFYNWTGLSPSAYRAKHAKRH